MVQQSDTMLLNKLINFGTSNVTYTAQSSAIQDSVAQTPRGVTFNNDGTMIYYVTGGAFNPVRFMVRL